MSLAQAIAAKMAPFAGEDVGIGRTVVKFDGGQDGVVVIDATSSPAKISCDDRAADCTVKIGAPFLHKTLAGEFTVGEAYLKFVRGVEGKQALAVLVQPFLRRVAAGAARKEP